MISPEPFIALLEQKDIISAELIARLRRQVVKSAQDTSSTPLSAEALARWLIAQGHLTKPQAQRMLAQVKVAERSQAVEQPASEQPAAPADEDDEISLAPLEEDKPRAGLSRPAEVPEPVDDLIPLDDELEELEELDELIPLDDDELVPSDDDQEDFGLVELKEQPSRTQAPPKPSPEVKAPPRKPSSQQPAKRQPPPRPTPDRSAIEEVKPAGGSPLDGLSVLGVGGESAGLDPLAPKSKKGRGGGKGKKSRKKKGTSASGNPWDSKLMLLGGGGLLALVILGGSLVWLYGRQNADKMFETANEFYSQGSYTKAISSYTDYVDQFPDHSGAGLARVRRGLSRLRQKTGGSTNHVAAFETAKQVLGEISGESEFSSEARPELVSLLPGIAEGLASQAREKLDPDLVAKTNETLALVDKYLPASMRPDQRLKDIRANVGLAEHRIGQGRELAKAITAMTKAAGQGDTNKAYQIRGELLEQYPEVLNDSTLRDAVIQLAQAEQEAIRWVDEPQAPESALPESPVEVVTHLAVNLHRADVPDAQGRLALVNAGGAAFGLDATNGKVVWRVPTAPTLDGNAGEWTPFPVSSRPDSDVIIPDPGSQSVLCVAGPSGALQWRQVIGEPMDAPPVLAADLLLVPTRGGKLLAIDLASGQRSGYVALPQPAVVSPVHDPARSVIYQLAEHSNLYVLEEDGSGSRETVYLGHEPGTIAAAPLLISRFLIIAENHAVENSRLRVLQIESSGDEADEGAAEGAAEERSTVRVIQEFPLEGRIDAAAHAEGVRVVVMTDQGYLHVFEMTASDPSQPLKQLAKRMAAGEGHLETGSTGEEILLVRYPVILGDQVWVADSQLTRYDVQASRGRLQPQGTENLRTVPRQPPTRIGRAVMHARSRWDVRGMIVSAEDVDGGPPYWETRVATPMMWPTRPGQPASTPLTTVTMAGAVYQLDPKNSPEVHDEPLGAVPSRSLHHPVVDLIGLPDGGLLLVPGGPDEALVACDDQGGFRRIPLSSPLGGPCTLFEGGLLVPTTDGRIVWLDPSTGQPKSEPFQPRMEPGATMAWRAPVLIGSKEFVVTDGRRGLFRVGVESDPRPYLAELVGVSLSQPIDAPLAVSGTWLFAADTAGTLTAYELPELTVAGRWPLDGLPVWGPISTDSQLVLIATDANELHAADGTGKVVWRIPWPHGRPVGRPLSQPGDSGDDLLLCTAAGKLVLLAAVTGEVSLAIDLQRPLATGPIPDADTDGWLIGGADGQILRVGQPAARGQE